MTNQNNFVYFGDITVSMTRSNQFYKVELDYETTVFVEANLVDDVISACKDEDLYLTAIILAYIEFARINHNKIKSQRKAKKIDETILIQSISELLSFYHSEKLIQIFEELKWHEIEMILTAESPVREINKRV